MRKEIFVAACFGVVFGVVVGGHLAEVKQGHGPTKSEMSDMEKLLQQENQSVAQLCNENQRLRVQIRKLHLKPELGSGQSHFVFMSTEAQERYLRNSMPESPLSAKKCVTD